MPRRYKFPLGLAFQLSSGWWKPGWWKPRRWKQGTKGRLQHQPEGSRQRREKWTERSARRIHGAGREGGSLAGQLRQGSGDRWSALGRGGRRETQPRAPCAHPCNPHNPRGPLFSSPGS